MKKMTLRKMSSQDRININKFWNEMEEFYSRQERSADVWDCDKEVEEVMSRVVCDQEEVESNGSSCYSSANSSFSSGSSSISSPTLSSDPLPMPPSLLHTTLLLSLVERLHIDRISTAV